MWEPAISGMGNAHNCAPKLQAYPPIFSLTPKASGSTRLQSCEDKVFNSRSCRRITGKNVAGVMVNGFTKFKEKFQGFENQYVIIGGTACDLIMENEELPFRATKDINIVLIVESITAEFGRRFWEYVKEAGYEHLNKSTGNSRGYEKILI